MTTWLLFDTRAAAQAACDEMWARFVAHHADGAGIDDKKATVDWVRDFPAPAAVAKAAQMEVWGRNAFGVRVREFGITRRWDSPRPTRDGKWAVKCLPFDESGGPAPEWPIPPALP